MKAKEVKQVSHVKVTLQIGPETLAVVEALAAEIGRKFQGMPFTKTGVLQAAIGLGLEQLVRREKIVAVEGQGFMRIPGSILE